jgi:hypothetical protein
MPYGLIDKSRYSRRGIILQEANPVSGVFQNIDPPTPSPPGECVPFPPLDAGGGHTRWVERGWGVNSFARRQTLLCTILYIR